MGVRDLITNALNIDKKKGSVPGVNVLPVIPETTPLSAPEQGAQALFSGPQKGIPVQNEQTVLKGQEAIPVNVPKVTVPQASGGSMVPTPAAPIKTIEMPKLEVPKEKMATSLKEEIAKPKYESPTFVKEEYTKIIAPESDIKKPTITRSLDNISSFFTQPLTKSIYRNVKEAFPASINRVKRTLSDIGDAISPRSEEEKLEGKKEIVGAHYLQLGLQNESNIANIDLQSSENDLKARTAELIEEYNITPEDQIKYGGEVINIKAYLRDKKIPITDKVIAFQQEMDTYDKLLKKVRTLEVTRNPLVSSAAETQEGIDKLTNGVMIPTFVNKDGTSYRDMGEKQNDIANKLLSAAGKILGSYKNIADTIQGTTGADEYGRESTRNTDDYVTSNENMKKTSDYLALLKEKLDMNYGLLTGKDGKIDDKKLLDFIYSDKDLKESQEDIYFGMNKDLEGFMSRYSSAEFKRGGALRKSRLASNKQWSIADERTQYNLMNGKQGFGGLDNMIRGEVGRDTALSMFRNAMLSNVADTMHMATDVAILLIPVVGYASALGKMGNVSNLGLGLKGMQAAKAANVARRLGLGSAEEIVLGLGLNTRLDKEDIGNSNFALNIVTDGLGGLFKWAKPGYTKMLAEQVRKLPTVAERIKYIKDEAGLLIVGRVLEDTENLESNINKYVMKQFGALKGNSPEIMNAMALRNIVSNLENIPVEDIGKMKIDELFGMITSSSAWNKKSSGLREYINTTIKNAGKIDDMQKASIIKNALVDYAKNFSAEMINKFTKRVISTAMFDNGLNLVVDKLADSLGIVNPTVAQKLALSTALSASIFGGKKTSLVSELLTLIKKGDIVVNLDSAKIPVVEKVEEAAKMMAKDTQNPASQKEFADNLFNQAQKNAKQDKTVVAEAPKTAKVVEEVPAPAAKTSGKVPKAETPGKRFVNSINELYNDIAEYVKSDVESIIKSQGKGMGDEDIMSMGGPQASLKQKIKSIVQERYGMHSPTDVRYNTDMITNALYNRAILGEKEYGGLAKGYDKATDFVGEGRKYSSSEERYNQLNGFSDMIDDSIMTTPIKTDMINKIKTYLSDSVKKFEKGAEKLGEQVLNGYAQFFRFVDENGVILSTMKFNDKINGITKILGDGEVSKIFIGLSGGIINNIKKLSKLDIITKADLDAAIDSIGTMFHEIGHVSSYNIDAVMRKQIMGALDYAIFSKTGTKVSVNFEEIKNIIGDQLFSARKGIYEDMAKNGFYDDILNEVFADKFKGDLMKYIFDEDSYMTDLLKARDEVVGLYGDVSPQKAKTKKFLQMVDSVVTKVGDFLKTIIDTLGFDRGNIKDMMSFVNYSIIKGEADLMTNPTKVFGTKLLYEKKSASQWIKNMKALKGGTGHRNTLLKIVSDEAYPMMDVLKSGKVPEDFVISPNFLYGEGEDMLVDIFGADNKLFLEAMAIAKKNAIDIGIKTDIVINKFFDAATNTLKLTSDGTVAGKRIPFGLNDVLSGISRRISTGKSAIETGGKRSGGVLFGPLLTAMKYAINSNPEETLKILGEFFNEFFSQTGKDMMNFGGSDFVKKFSTMMGTDNAGDGLVGLYKRTREILLQKGISPAEVEDILNPLIYDATNYVRMIGGVDIAKLKKTGRTLDDAVISLLISKRSSQIPDLLKADYPYGITKIFNKTPLNEVSQNIVSISLNNKLGEFLNAKGYNIPMTLDNYNEWMQKIVRYRLVDGSLGEQSMLLENLGNYVVDSTKSLYPEGWDKIGVEVQKGMDEVMSLYLGGKKTEADELLKKIDNLLTENNMMNDTTRDILDSSYAKLGKEEVTDTSIANIMARKIADTYDYVGVEKRMNIEDIQAMFKEKVELQDMIDKKLSDPLVVQKEIEDIIMNGSSKQEIDKSIESVEDILGLERGTLIKELEEGGTNISLLDIIGGEEEAMGDKKLKVLFEKIINGDADFAEMLTEYDVFRNLIRTSLDEAGVGIEGHEIFTLDTHGNIITKFEHANKSFISKISKFVTFSTLASINVEAQDMLAHMNRVMNDGMVKVSGDYLGEFGKTKTGLKRDVIDIQGYLRNVRKRYLELVGNGSLLKKSRINEEKVMEIYNKAVRGVSNEGLVGNEIKLHQLFNGFFDDIGKFRGDEVQRLGNISDLVMANNEGMEIFRASSREKKDRLINRLTGLRNYFSNDEIKRLEEIYGKNRGTSSKGNAILSNFSRDMLMGGLLDKGLHRYNRVLDEFGRRAVKFGVAKLFGPQAYYKAGQQIISNVMHMKGIISGFGFKFNDLDAIDSFLKKEIKFFDVGGKNVGFDEIIKAKWNVMIRGDAATQTAARRAAAAQALYPMADVGGMDAVTKFQDNIRLMNEIYDKYGVSEGARTSKSRAENVFNYAIRKGTKGMTPRETMIYKPKAKKEFEFAQKFYHGDYTSFLGKTRLAMNTFYVIDQIPELSSIPIVTQNRRAFGLMKRAIGKSGEYVLKIQNALSKYPKTRKGVIAALTEAPIFKQIGAEIAQAMRLSRYLDRVSGGEVDQKQLLSSVCVPIAATMMSFGDLIGRSTLGYYTRGRDATRDEKGKVAEERYKTLGSTVVNLLIDTLSRFGLYEGFMVNDLTRAMVTGGQGKNAMDKLAKGIETILKRGITDIATKPWVIRAQGAMTDDSAGNLLAQWIGMLTNTRLENQRLYDQSRDMVYYKNSGKYESSLISDVAGALNILSPITARVSADMGVLKGGVLSNFLGVGSNLTQYREDNNLDIFTNKYASKEELLAKFNKMNSDAIINSTEFKNYLNSPNAKPEYNEDGSISTKTLIEAGLSDKVPANIKVITDGLSLNGKTGKGLAEGYRANISTEEKQELGGMFSDIIDNNKKGVSKDDATATKQFILAYKKFGGDMAMSEYIKAFRAGYIATRVKEEGITTKEKQSASDPTYGGYEGYEPIGGMDIKRKYAEIQQEANQMTNQIILDNRDILAGEKHVGIDLEMQYVKNDKSFPLANKYQGGIGDMESTVSEHYNLMVMDGIMQRDGYGEGGYTLAGIMAAKAGTMMAAVDQGVDFSDPVQKRKSDEKKLLISNVFKSLVNKIEQTDPNPSSVAIKKISMAFGLSKFMPSITKNIILSDAVSSALKDSFASLTDILTDSVPADVESAIELATNINMHPGGGKAGAADNAKPVKEKVAKMIDGFNKVAVMSARLGGDGISLSPKIKYEYNSRTGAIKPVEVKVTTPKAEGEPIRGKGADMTSAKLDVTPLPVKEGRVIGGKYGARAISNAKIYSRKVKFA